MNLRIAVALRSEDPRVCIKPVCIKPGKNQKHYRGKNMLTGADFEAYPNDFLDRLGVQVEQRG